VSDLLDPDRLLAFHEAGGFTVHRSPNGWWYEAGPRFLLGVPTHRALTIDPAEAKQVLRATGALGLRYVAADPACGRSSWQMVATGTDYDLSQFSSNTRSKVRRGLKQNTVRPISGAELAKVGEQAFRDTVERQGRAGRYGIERWHRMLEAADATPGIEIWSAWHDDVMAAYLLVMVFDDGCEFYEARSRNDTLRFYPNNALIYTVTCEMLKERGVEEITFGIEGLEELGSLDAFKLAMGYTKKPIRQHVIFHPALQAALSVRPLRSALALMARRPQASAFWRRAEGLLELSGLAG